MVSLGKSDGSPFLCSFQREYRRDRLLCFVKTMQTVNKREKMKDEMQKRRVDIWKYEILCYICTAFEEIVFFTQVYFITMLPSI